MSRILEKIYLEITNRCNLSCSFCIGHRRKPNDLTRDEFHTILSRIEARARILYFHLMGEPLLHADLPHFIAEAGRRSFKVHLTTNGTLLPERAQTLYNQPHLHRLNVSLHSLSEAGVSLESVCDAADTVYASLIQKNSRFLLSYRLWTGDAENSSVVDYLERRYALAKGSIAGTLSHKNGVVLKGRIALHTAETFEWPSLNTPEKSSKGFCRALRDQAGILSDGTVVPCCLDSEGTLSLGNVFTEDWDAILDSQRARDFYEGFSKRQIAEELCRRCGYRERFSTAHTTVENT